MVRSEEFGQGAAAPGMSESDIRILDFARTMPEHPADQAHAILGAFGYRGPTYFRRLGRILSGTDAATTHPDVVAKYEQMRADASA